MSKYVELFSALYASGKWSIDELKRLAVLNFLRVFKEVEKVRITGVLNPTPVRVPGMRGFELCR